MVKRGRWWKVPAAVLATVLAAVLVYVCYAFLAYYRLADVFLCMSEHEGFCIPLLEAMYFHAPVLAYDSSAIAGTLGGSGILLKEKNPAVEIVAVEPFGSAVLSGEAAGPHGLQGIGAGFVPGVLKTDLIDRVVKVKDEEALKTGQEVAKTDGLLVGISSAAALFAATQLAKDPAYKGKTIVVLLPDTGERYLSTALFDETK